jgi:hypothetical protein
MKIKNAINSVLSTTLRSLGLSVVVGGVHVQLVQALRRFAEERNQSVAMQINGAISIQFGDSRESFTASAPALRFTEPLNSKHHESEVL